MSQRAVWGVAALSTILVTTADRARASAAAVAEWKLVWSDEFNEDGPPRPANWTYEHGLVRNDEAQFYQPQNASCAGGRLIIEARRERTRNPGFVSTSTHWPEREEFAEYTSASLTTKGAHEWQYGRFEMRARIDAHPGLWPAWWTLGVRGEWPDGGEVDMMEYYRDMLLANVGWGSGTRWVAKWDSIRVPLSSLGEGWTDRFHVWRMDWDADRIELSVDGRVLNTTELAGTVDAVRHTDPFHQPHYMLLNLAVGGTNGGDPSHTSFPRRLEIDYVRVYQRENEQQQAAGSRQ
jgi:beta-glucanase (GH16 family)